MERGGSYEVGSALWSLAIHRGSPWYNESGAAGPAGAYLDGLLDQCQLPPERGGFFDAGSKRWIRSLEWDGSRWSSWTPGDWKYAMLLQEGVLEHLRLQGGMKLRAAARAQLQYVLGEVRADGSVRGVPDGYGTARHEYGVILSVLGLGAEVFVSQDPLLAARCRNAGEAVLRLAVDEFQPDSSEDSAILLLGACRVVRARVQLDHARAGRVADDISAVVGQSDVSLDGEELAGALSLPARAIRVR